MGRDRGLGIRPVLRLGFGIGRFRLVGAQRLAQFAQKQEDLSPILQLMAEPDGFGHVGRLLKGRAQALGYHLQVRDGLGQGAFGFVQGAVEIVRVDFHCIKDPYSRNCYTVPSAFAG